MSYPSHYGLKPRVTITATGSAEAPDNAVVRWDSNLNALYGDDELTFDGTDLSLEGNFDAHVVVVSTATIGEVSVTTGTLTGATITSLTADTAVVNTATFTEASITTGTFAGVSVTSLTVSGTATVATANITTGVVDGLTVTTGTVAGLTVTSATLGTAAITTATLAGATITTGTVATLSASQLALEVTIVTTDYTVAAADWRVVADAETNAIEVWLPAAGSSTNRLLSVSKVDTSTNVVSVRGGPQASLNTLIAHAWHMDETTETRVAAAGTLNLYPSGGAVTYTTGPAAVGGTAAYITNNGAGFSSYPYYIDPYDGDWSISFWTDPEEAGNPLTWSWGYLEFRQADYGGEWSGIYYYDTVAEGYRWGARVDGGPGSVWSDNGFHHNLWTYDKAAHTLKQYIDGNLVATDTAFYPLLPANAYWGGPSYVGTTAAIDELYIWLGRCLDQTAASALASGQLYPFAQTYDQVAAEDSQGMDIYGESMVLHCDGTEWHII